MGIQSLSIEILLHALSYVPKDSIKKTILVCRLWHDVVLRFLPEPLKSVKGTLISKKWATYTLRTKVTPLKILGLKSRDLFVLYASNIILRWNLDTKSVVNTYPMPPKVRASKLSGNFLIFTQAFHRIFIHIDTLNQFEEESHSHDEYHGWNDYIIYAADEVSIVHYKTLEKWRLLPDIVPTRKRVCYFIDSYLFVEYRDVLLVIDLLQMKIIKKFEVSDYKRF